MFIRRMDDQSRRLVDNKQVVILIDDRYVVCFHVESIGSLMVQVNSLCGWKQYLYAYRADVVRIRWTIRLSKSPTRFTDSPLCARYAPL